MKGSKHLYTPACTAILVFTGFLAQTRMIDLSDLMSRQRPLSFSRKLDGVVLMLFFISQ